MIFKTKTEYFHLFDENFNGMFLLKGSGASVSSRIVDSGVVDGEAIFQGRISPGGTGPALSKRLI